MRNTIMTREFTEKLTELLQIWAKLNYKHANYTDTYSREALLKFLRVTEDWTMFQHCVEDREAMSIRDKQDFANWKENETIDRLAKEDQEYKDSLDNPLRN